MRRLVAALLAGALVAVVLVLVLSGGSNPYVVRVRLADAAGLRQQSPVMIGGVQAGTVNIRLAPGDQVVAELNLDRAQAPVGRDASVSIAAVNFLGQKEAQLTRGTIADPAPSGYTIPASRVTVSTDLDQVLDVLDASTRTRLTVLIDAAGSALTGRRQDFNTLLRELPPSLSDANTLLGQLVGDNHTLAHLVSTSDTFVSAVSRQRTQLGNLVGTAGQAAVSVEARRQQLSQTLAAAPATMTTLQSFLAKLQATTVPLGPAARDITATAPLLNNTLGQVDPFVHTAAPALSTATAVAPELTQLARAATPVVVQANPTVASLATFSTALQPVSNILNHSVDNLLAVVDNWSRAIQFRDGLSHVFRGEAGITADVLQSVIDRMVAGSASKATSAVHDVASKQASTWTAPGAPAANSSHGRTQTAQPPSSAAAGTAGAAGAAGAAAPAQPPAAGPSPSPLSSLLSWLIH